MGMKVRKPWVNALRYLLQPKVYLALGIGLLVIDKALKACTNVDLKMIPVCVFMWVCALVQTLLGVAYGLWPPYGEPRSHPRVRTLLWTIGVLLVMLYVLLWDR
jgi:uncharacterized membrane protein